MRILVPLEHGGELSAMVRGLSMAGYLEVYGQMPLIVLIATVALTLFAKRLDPEFPKSWADGLA